MSHTSGHGSLGLPGSGTILRRIGGEQQSYGAGGISSTAGDQRDTGSGFGRNEIGPYTRRDDQNTVWHFKYVDLKVIGKGAFGVVYEGYRYYIEPRTGSDGKYAIKELRTSTNEYENNQKRHVIAMEKEVNQYLKKLNEPSNKEHHIVKPLSIIENESPICTYIVTEYCSGGDLARYLKSVAGERVEESKAKDIIRQVSTGLLFLHRGNFIHRDIKAANILIDERSNESTNQKDAIYKIADFGLATKLNRRKDLKTVCGTKRFMAPEMTGYTEYGPEVDIWSLGVLFFSLLVGKHPTVDSTKVEIYEPIKSAYQKPIYPKDLGISEDTQTLVNKMLEVDPMLRISIEKIQSTLSTYTKYPKSPATNRTISDSGIASSYSSGSAGANGSGLGTPRHLNLHLHERNMSGGGLQIVEEERSTIQSGLEYPHLKNVTPRSNFCRSSNDLYKPPQPVRPVHKDFTYKQHQEDFFRTTSPPVSLGQRSTSSFVDKIANNMPSTITVSSSYIGKQNVGQNRIQLQPPLTTLRLRPSTKRHQLKNKGGTICIKPNNKVVLELNIERRTKQNGESSTMSVRLILTISADGQEVNIERNGVLQSFKYDNLPEEHWRRYNYAAEFVKNVKACTPKITWYNDKAKCRLMENSSSYNPKTEANFEVEFYSGVKLEHDATKGIVAVSTRNIDNLCKESVSNIEKFDVKTSFEKLRNIYPSESDLVLKYRDHVKEIDMHWESFARQSQLQYFPLTIGKLPRASSCSSLTMTSHSRIVGKGSSANFLLANQNHYPSSSDLRRTSPIEQQQIEVFQTTRQNTHHLQHSASLTSCYNNGYSNNIS